MTVVFNIDCPIDAILEAGGKVLGHIISRTNLNDRRFEDGSRFISSMGNGLVFSMYNHPTEHHSATAIGGHWNWGYSKSSAPAGQWAVACSSVSCFGGAKTFYSVSPK